MIAAVPPRCAGWLNSPCHMRLGKRANDALPDADDLQTLVCYADATFIRRTASPLCGQVTKEKEMAILTVFKLLYPKICLSPVTRDRVMASFRSCFTTGTLPTPNPVRPWANKAWAINF